MDSSPRKVRVYPSLVRTVHVAGVERTAAGLILMVVLILVFSYRANWVTPTLAVVFVVGVLPVLRRATRRDPQVLAVFRRHVATAALYEGLPPCTHPYRRDERTF